MEKRSILLDAMRDALATELDGKFVSPENVQRSWIFDFRKLLLRSNTLDVVAELFLEELRHIPQFQIGGLETAAIALVSGIIMKSQEQGRPLNGFYIRKSRRKDGFQKQIEGNFTKDDIVLVDDILNSGRSFMRQIAVLEAEGRTVRAVCVLLRYRDISQYDELTRRGIHIHSLFTLEDFPETGGLRTSPKHTPLTIPESPFSIAWKFQSNDPSYYFVLPKSAPVIDKQRVYFGGDNGVMWALNQRDGSVAWSFRTLFGAGEKHIFSSPALANGHLYFGAYDGNFYCLNAETGDKEWVYREADWIGSSPVVAPNSDSVFVGLEFGLWRKQGGLVCLDAHTGKKRWMQPIPTLVHSSPAYIFKYELIVVGSSEGKVYAFHAKDGKPAWTLQSKGAVRAGFSYDETTDTICFGSEDGSIYIADAKTGAVQHTFATLEPVYTTPLTHAGIVYCGALDKRVLSIDIKTGLLRWEHWTHGRVFASPMRIGNSIFIGSNDGRLYEIDSETGRELCYFQVSERIVNRIAYNPETKFIFLPTHANEMYCIQQSESGT